MNEKKNDYPLVTFPEKFNMAHYYLDKHIEEKENNRGEKVAIYFNDKEYTYNDVYKQSNQFAHSLKDLGLVAEDRVCVLMGDRPEFILSCFAIWKIGACFIPVDLRTTFDTLIYMIDLCRPKAIIVTPNLLHLIAEAIPSIDKSLVNPFKIIIVGDLITTKPNISDDYTIYYFSELIKTKKEINFPIETSRDDVAFWGWTSGTTGMPKAVVHLHHDFPYITEVLQRVHPLTDKDVSYSSSKLSFIMAEGTNFLFLFAQGGSVILHEGVPTPKDNYEIFTKHKNVTVFCGLPFVYERFLLYCEENKVKKDNLFPAVRYFWCAGDALHEHILTDWKEAFGQDILNNIGSTESCHWYISSRKGDCKPGSLGKINPGTEAKIVPDEKCDGEHSEDENDESECEGGQSKRVRGTLWVRTESLAMCYWRSSEATKKAMQGCGWFNTEDKVEVDEDGFYWFLGREKEMFKFGAEFVSPVAMANALSCNNDYVKECKIAVIEGIPIAFIILNEGYEGGEELKKKISDSVTEHTWGGRKLIPHSIEFVTEYPRSNRAKVDMVKLKQQYTEKKSKVNAKPPQL